MPSSGYPLRQGVADLASAGFLEGCLVPVAGRWRLISSAEIPTLTGAFCGACLDSRQLSPRSLFVALTGVRADGRNFINEALAAGAAAVLTRAWAEPGEDPLFAQAAPSDSGAVVMLSNDPVAALARLAVTWRRQQEHLRLVAVTGSNGKTTTKDFIAAALSTAGSCHATSGNYNNELGLPLTLLGLSAEHRYAVVELGASAEGDIAGLASLARPEVGVITNAAEAHLAQFGSLAGVIRGKGELLEALPVQGRAILNADSPGFAEWCERAPCPCVTFGRDDGDYRWRWHPGTKFGTGVLELAGQSWQVPLPGEHNGINLAAAILAARAVGAGDEQIRRGLDRFKPSAHRSRLLELAGIRVLDDCYNANPTSMVRAAIALCALGGGGRTVAVLGRMAELGPTSVEIHHRTGRELFDTGLDVLLAVGVGSEELSNGFTAAGGMALHCAGKEEAVAWLTAHTRPPDRVLIKGSRATAMEEVITLWREQLTRGGSAFSGDAGEPDHTPGQGSADAAYGHGEAEES
jgi:UDP-N-acetylmuramoyl-tripeptide--D-alanyl-D-alanine ligase